MTNLMKLSRELVDNLLKNNEQALGKEHFFIFTISKFILLKERILKKDSTTKTLYFNNVENAKYIPSILFFAEQIKKNSSFIFNDQKIQLEDSTQESQDLYEALWIYNKVRDSLAHGQYTLDLENNMIIINNDHSNNKNNPYKLVCSIPIELLNYITFHIERTYEDNEIFDIKELSSDYESYLIEIKKLNSKNAQEYKKGYSTDKYDVFKSNNEENSESTKHLSPSFIYYDKLENNTLSKLLQDNYIKELYRLINDKKSIKEQIEELCRLIIDNANSKTQLEQVEYSLKKLKVLVEQIEELDKDEFEKKTYELISEIANILEIKLAPQNINGIIALYSYMNLVFSQNIETDCSHICFRNLFINFDPLQKGKGTGKVYNDLISSINKICIDFSKIMDSKINEYYKNPNEKFREILNSYLYNFYIKIMSSIGKRNRLILTSIRNSIEHGNYYVNKNGSLILYDQTDHNNNDSIKFICDALPQDLFHITESIEIGNTEEYVMRDFFEELETIVDKTILNKIINTINKLTKIIYGKEIDTSKSIEQISQEEKDNNTSDQIPKI